MPSLYKHAQALLVSLKDEPIFAMTIPGKLQSYLAAGAPVVAMLNGEGSDVVTRSKAGMTCRASDAEGLADVLARMAALPPEALQEMARNARDFSRREFDRSMLMSRLEKWLTDLAASSHASR
jgi:glycosyltransferase involved in cell wall biosynthesis